MLRITTAFRLASRDFLQGWKSGGVIMCAIGLGVMAALPVASQATWGKGLELSLRGLPRIECFWPSTSSFSRSVCDLRQAGIDELSGLLMGITAGMVLVVAMTLLTAAWARSCSRGREDGIRRSFGASLSDLRSTRLMEGVLLAAPAITIGAIMGSIVAAQALAAWRGTAAESNTGAIFGVLSAGTAAVVLSGQVIHSRRIDIARVVAGPEANIGLAFLTLQLGFTLAVLVTASLLARSGLRRNSTSAHGIESAEIITLSNDVQNSQTRSRAYRRLLSQVRGNPIMAITGWDAYLGMGPLDLVYTECGKCYMGGIPTSVKVAYATRYTVGPRGIRFLDIPLIEGREILAADSLGATPVAVVSQTLATYFQDSHAIGRHLNVDPLSSGDAIRYKVVGIVADRPAAGFGGARVPLAAVYFSALQQPPRAADVLIRGEGRQVAARAVADFAPRTGFRILRQSSTDSLSVADRQPVSWFERAFGWEAWLMATVSLLGTLAMMNIWVESILPELAVRYAVGARRRQLVGWVLRRAMLVTLGGTLWGLWFGIVLWGALPEVVPGLQPWDSGMFLRFALLMALGLSVGALIPMWGRFRGTLGGLGA